MGFNFKEVQPNRGQAILEDSLRLSSSRLAFGDNVLPGASKGTKVNVQIDPENMAIKLSVGYTGYAIQEDISNVSYLSNGKRLLKDGMKLGDYIPAPGNPNVYVLASGLTE